MNGRSEYCEFFLLQRVQTQRIICPLRSCLEHSAFPTVGTLSLLSGLVRIPLHACVFLFFPHLRGWNFNSGQMAVLSCFEEHLGETLGSSEEAYLFIIINLYSFLMQICAHVLVSARLLSDNGSMYRSKAVYFYTTAV